jgi:hypothetical protein
MQVDRKEINRNFTKTLPQKLKESNHDSPQKTIYKNRHQRLNEPKPPVYGHSFDFSTQHIHKRDIHQVNRKEINDYYTNISRQHKEPTDSSRYCEIYQEQVKLSVDGMFMVTLEYGPTKADYADCTKLDDYICLDVSTQKLFFCNL